MTPVEMTSAGVAQTGESFSHDRGKISDTHSASGPGIIRAQGMRH